MSTLKFFAAPKGVVVEDFPGDKSLYLEKISSSSLVFNTNVANSESPKERDSECNGTNCQEPIHLTRGFQKIIIRKTGNEERLCEFFLSELRDGEVVPPPSDALFLQFDLNLSTDKYPKIRIEQFTETRFSFFIGSDDVRFCLLYTSPSPRDRQKSRMPSSA